MCIHTNCAFAVLQEVDRREEERNYSMYNMWECAYVMFS